ncbi:MAG: ATP-binding cassette domain-containing protein [Duodenibacillus sp.]|nr:ATP-binding cassette domain-containing protein [Duodenibacillus sp.]
MFRIEISRLVKRFHGQAGVVEPVRDLTLTLEAGAVCSVIGQSGCGKTTLLRLLAGLERPDGGTIAFADESGRSSEPVISIVFQEPRLFAWMNVRSNIALAVRRLPRAERDRKVDAVLELVGLTAVERAYPQELSGGMAQRVGLARALVNEPDILLMDEAFGSLDAITRQRLYREFVAILAKRPMTVVLVTHDVTEAVQLSGRIVLLAGGTVARSWRIGLPYPRSLGTEGVGALAEQVLSELFNIK